MKARVEKGYWVFKTVPGYRSQQTRGEGKILVRDEPVASIIQEALEGYAAGRFQSQAEVQRFLEAQPAFPKQLPGGKLRLWRVTKLLTNPLYAGHVEAEKWNVSRRKGRHEGLISLTTFEKIQARVAGAATAPVRKNIGQDFALRGFVTCADCDTPLRSCFSKSCTGRSYAYYLCQTKGCASYGKSIPRDRLEGDFEKLLKSLRPSAVLMRLARDMFFDAWEQRRAQTEEIAQELKRNLTRIERQIDGFLNRIGETASAAAAKAYERNIDALERDRLLAEDRISEMRRANGPDSKTAKEKLELGLAFLSNPWKIWASGDQTLRRAVLRLAFSERLSYCRKTGPRTAKTTLPFNVLGGLSGSKCQMVRSRRLELPRVLPHSDLNAARLPIPPRPHW